MPGQVIEIAAGTFGRREEEEIVRKRTIQRDLRTSSEEKEETREIFLDEPRVASILWNFR